MRLCEVDGLEQRIFGIEAATLAGLKAKAGVLDYLDTTMGVSAKEEWAASLVIDIMALVKVRPAPAPSDQQSPTAP